MVGPPLVAGAVGAAGAADDARDARHARGVRLVAHAVLRYQGQELISAFLQNHFGELYVHEP